MDSNQKKFGVYVFLSTFSRNLIEVFIPIILYKFGYSIKEVVFYYFMANLLSLVISYPCIQLSKKYDNKILSLIGIISFLILQILLNRMAHNYIYLLSIAFFFALYRRGYWISRRYYNLMVIKKEKISTTYSVISIINQIGVIISAYCGAIILDYLNLKVVTCIAIVLFILSIIPLAKLKFKHERKDDKLDLVNTIKQVPKNTIYIYGSYELLNVIKFLIPLYIFIYVKNTYQTVGLINLISNLSLMIFTYIFGKKLDNKKGNYLALSIILTVIVYILKINFAGILLLVISFAEGFITKMYELSVSKEFYTLSKKFEYNNYNLLYEIVQNGFRTAVTLILFVLGYNLKLMIYLTLIFVLIGVFFIRKENIVENYKE